MLTGKYRYIRKIIFICLMVIETIVADEHEYGSHVFPIESKFSFSNFMLCTKIIINSFTNCFVNKLFVVYHNLAIQDLKPTESKEELCRHLNGTQCPICGNGFAYRSCCRKLIDRKYACVGLGIVSYRISRTKSILKFTLLYI